MKKKLYSIESTVTGLCSEPFCAHNDIHAGRLVAASIEGTVLEKWPNDHRVICIGGFDDETGNLSLVDHYICYLLIDLVPQKNSDQLDLNEETQS